jgi:tetratricopeptide (TPR) repeat protein
MFIERVQPDLTDAGAQRYGCQESWRSFATSAVGLVALVLIVYFPALRGEFIWTDHANIADNIYLRSWRGLSPIWSGARDSAAYQPLTDTTYWLEYRLWGQRPLGFHLMNVLLHAANALLFWRLLRRLALPGTWLAAAIFAVHPVHVQSVGWISGRAMLMSVMFSLASLMIYLRCRRTRGSRLRPAYVGAIIHWRAGAFAVGIVFLLTLISAFAFSAADGLPHSLTGDQFQYLTSLAIVALLAGALARLSCVALSSRKFEMLRASCGIILLACLGFLSWRRAFLYRDELTLWRYAAAQHSLSPAAHNRFGVVLLERGQPQQAADHFQIALKADPNDTAALANLARVYEATGQPEKAIAQCQAALRIAPLDPTLLRDLGSLYVRLDRRDEALRHYLRAVEALPDDEVIHNNLGLLLAEEGGGGRLDEAIAHYRRAIRGNPFSIPARLNLAGALFRHGDPAGASEQLQHVVQIDPSSFEAFMNSGAMLGQLREFQKAERMFRAAIHLKPESAEAYDNLGIALAAQGRVSEAVYSFGRAVNLKSGFVLARRHLDESRRHHEPPQTPDK